MSNKDGQNSNANSNIPRYFGKITLKMIDDLLNPISGSNNDAPNIKLLPPSATGGRGFVATDTNNNNNNNEQSCTTARKEDDEKYYVPFHKRDHTLIQEYARQKHTAASNQTETHSISSKLSHMESISTFNHNHASKAPKFEMDKETIMESDIEIDDEASDTENETDKEFEKKLEKAKNEQNSNLEDITYVYREYNMKHTYDSNLKITSKRDAILDTVASYQVCIIQGSTGCGKTTQVPMYILDHYSKLNEPCNIIITQPRRIAAISVASRVCNERGWNLGSICGYQIGLDRRFVSADTRISYVTTGILLQKLINNDIDKYTHIIVDEVHERDLDVDFTLLSLKLLLQKHANKRVILMSATIDCELFVSYFVNNNRVPIVQIDGSPYNVDTFYLDDLRREPFTTHTRIKQLSKTLTNPQKNPEESSIRLSDDTLDLIVELIRYFDEIEKEKITSNANSAERIIGDFAEMRASVLIFAPGMYEITRIEESLRTKFQHGQLNILPLHSDIAIEQQKRVFEKQQPTRRKIIISTSIAESSITVPDVKYVIDTCLTKQLWCDPVTNYTHLRVEWASKSSLNQRKGRAGRVSDGLCFRLITRQFHQTSLQEHDLPAMLRCPLEKLVLNTKRLNCGEPKKVLSLAIQPPELHDIERTILLLKEAGALTLRTNGFINPYDGDLTYAGKVMAQLPIDIKLSKLILLGHAFGRLRECVIIAAALSTKSFFSRYYKSHLEAFKAKWYWSHGSSCDFIAILNAYNMWHDLEERERFTSKNERFEWARKNMIDMYRLNETHQLRHEIEQRLKMEFNIVDNKTAVQNDVRTFLSGRESTAYDIDDPSDVERHQLILKIILAGAFYPNYFVASKIDEYDAYKSVCGKDIKSTVMVKGLPMNEGKLYHAQIMKIFQYCSRLMQIHYEDSKAYIEFKGGDDAVGDDLARNSVSLGVHLAVVMRLLRVPMIVRRFSDRETKKRLRHFEESRLNFRSMAESTLSLNTVPVDPLDRLNRLFFNNTLNNYDYDGNEPLVPARLATRNVNNGTGNLVAASSMNLFADFVANPEVLLQQVREFDVKLTQVLEFGRFWAQVEDEKFQSTIESIQIALNKDDYALRPVDPKAMHVGLLVAARYREPQTDDEYVYRAKVIRIDDDKRCVRILYVDFGNVETKKFDEIFKLSDEMQLHPFQAFECQLINLKANRLKCPNGVWTSAANKYFQKIVVEKKLFAKVFSVVDGVVRIELFIDDNGEMSSVNQMCFASDFAEFAEESSISIMSRDRMNANNLKSLSHKNTNNNESLLDLSMCMQQQSSNLVSMDNYNAIRDSNRNLAFRPSDDDDPGLYEGEIRLSGPYSPLEVQFYPLVRICKSKTALIDRDSINYAHIDDDTQVPYERLLVSSEVHLNAAGTKMLMRKTCLLPKIKGLMSLCCLLFAPTVEMRVSANSLKYTGALCGLGFDTESRRPIYVDDDIECAFDVNIDIADLNSVNLIRTAVNMIIGSEEAAASWTSDAKKLRNLQNTACNKLLNLIEKKRDYVPVVHFLNPGRWNQVPAHNIMQMEKSKDNEFYLLLNPVYLDGQYA